MSRQRAQMIDQLEARLSSLQCSLKGPADRVPVEWSMQVTNTGASSSIAGSFLSHARPRQLVALDPRCVAVLAVRRSRGRARFQRVEDTATVPLDLAAGVRDQLLALARS
jgi:hypothetical protein